MFQDKCEFEVELVVTSRHLITTYSRNCDEAERDAADLFADGETGIRLSYEIEQSDAWPVDSGPAELDEGEDYDSGE